MTRRAVDEQNWLDMDNSCREPDFLLIGAQKAATSWVWRMLEQHPGTALPKTKEIHFFGSAEIYRRGRRWYDSHFEGIGGDKLTGEASTSYFFDRVPFWFNESRQIEYDQDLPPLPQLVHDTLPDARIIVLLRDPVRRAISAWHHWLRKGIVSPYARIRKTALEHPKLRLLESGYYLRYLSAWIDAYPRDQVLVMFYETDVADQPAAGLRRLYQHVGLDPSFEPKLPRKRVHESWSWTRCITQYTAGPLGRRLAKGRSGRLIDHHPILERFAVSRSDVRFLQDKFRPYHDGLERLLDMPIKGWDYGATLHA